MRNRFRILVSTSLIAAALAPGGAGATQIILQSIEQMTYRSDAVVRAVPVATAPVSRWSNPDGTGLIVTATPFRVVESMLGDAMLGKQVTVEHLGGAVGEISMAVPGMPVFRPGEEVVLFMRRGDDGAYRVLDLSMGKFEVVFAGDGSRVLTRRDLADAEVVGATPSFPRTLDLMRASVARASASKTELLRSGKPLPDMGADAGRDAVRKGDR